ncbi:MAG: DNA repair exonuclease [Cyanobacteria bacterium]|nr:DNA repair exonuclease [Cyanobacteriota bacterium]MDW8201013.1 DNA repair exonuclease [Cyanobacteriota bacterium SKYGB_h_bin112]
MPRFLHIADVHLGYEMYGSVERSRDFFYALYDALERYAVAERVDFVLIAGDLFEHRYVLPAVLNQAQLCLELLKAADIPVLAIEGNHDHRPHGTKTSWLRYLADWDWLILLEPQEDQAEQGACYSAWSPETKRGGYIDLACGVRVIGSRWYGASAPQSIPLLANSIRQLPTPPPYMVMMFHHGLQGQIARYQGALDPAVLLPLREAGVDYLALGHIHKNYTLDDWIFNPGAIEANSIAESQEECPHGVYLVTMTEQGIQAELKRDYRQRSIVRLDFKVESNWTVEEVVERTIAYVQSHQARTADAIVEVKLHGQVSFNRLDVNVRDLRDQLHQRSGALVLLLRYDLVGTEYDTLSGWDHNAPPPRSAIETRVFTDLLAAHATYRDQADQLARALIDLKEQLLLGRSDLALYRLVEDALISR